MRHVSLLVCLEMFAAASSVQGASLVAADLRMEWDESLRVTQMAVGETQLRVAPRPFVELRDVSRPAWEAPAAAAGDPQGGWQLKFPATGARLTLTARADGGALRFSCRVQGDPMPARGLLLRFAFPFDASGWRWHRDMQNAVPIAPEDTCEDVVSLRAWADLPEWRQEPELRMGYSNRNFCTVVTGPVGLCLAVPLDRPCVFRTAYRAPARRLEILFDFALSPDTRRAHEAEFAFDLYACDAAWGFRDALAKYYRLYPAMFVRHVPGPGQWMAFSRLSEIDNANEFGFGLQEGAPEPDYDDRLGVLSVVYFTHAGMGANIPDYDPEKDPLPSHEVQVRAMESAFQRATGIGGLFGQVGLHDAEGKLDVRRWAAYAHLISQFNLDPELPYGQWTLRRALTTLEESEKSGRGRLDGFYYDGLTAGVNYRADHFRTADAPCLWDPAAKKPLLNNFFSSCEFARAAAEMLRPRGRITMMNGALGASFYVAPWLDVLGSETGLHIARERLNYIRATTHHKPFVTLLKGNYHQQIGRAEIDRYMQECLAYGIFPGFFDWPTSGLGPGSRYWDHPAYFERDRDLFRKYQPLCRALADAGWEPVTWAAADAPRVVVERFGPAAEGIVWFTLFNEGKEAVHTTLTLQARPLGLEPDQARAIDAIALRVVPLRGQGDVLVAEVDIPPGQVCLLQVARRDAILRWCLRRARDTLDAGARMREIDGDKPPLAVHWRPAGSTYTRQKAGGSWQLVLAGDASSACGASQWVMLFQPKPEKLVLRARVRAEGLVARGGQAGIECQLAWVTRSFSHYVTRFFEVPQGSYESKELQFEIDSPEPLRAIRMTPRLGRGVQGSLHLIRLSLTDAAGDDYVVDPDFSEWYEPFPAEWKQPVDEGYRQLQGQLAQMEGAVRDMPPAAWSQAADGIRRRCAELREAIRGQHAENGCRRVLRDLETVERHLALGPGWENF